jgi:hypothetical protein
MQLREILLACPAREDDLYKLHQLVWTFASSMSNRSSPEFLYRQEGSIIRVRSTHFNSRGSTPVRELRSGGALNHVAVDLVAVSRGHAGETAIPEEALALWSQMVIEKAGFTVHSLEATPMLRVGNKTDRIHGRAHRIAMPISRVVARVSVKDRAAAEHAWVHGLGRGRRFGMGMIQPI